MRLITVHVFELCVNDVVIAWPPGRAPILIASYMSESSAETATLNAAHAEIANIIAQTWA